MAKTEASGTFKCPHCRQAVPEGSRFCLFCGAPVGSPGMAGHGRSLLTLALLAMFIGGLALAAWGLASGTVGGRREDRERETAGPRQPLRRRARPGAEHKRHRHRDCHSGR
jgi:hypothetical protein